MNKFSIIAAATLAGLALTIAPASAKGPGWKAGGGNPPGFANGRKLGYASEGRPRGWTQGRKKGWRGATRPPGLAKPIQPIQTIRPVQPIAD